jgi:hypothetical protein
MEHEDKSSQSNSSYEAPPHHRNIGSFSEQSLVGAQNSSDQDNFKKEYDSK